MKFKSIKHKVNKLAIILAAFSACLGILITILYLITKSDGLVMIGFYHLFPTVAIHTILLLIVIINTILHKDDLKEHFTTIILMLLNIPLALGCFWAVSSFI